MSDEGGIPAHPSSLATAHSPLRGVVSSAEPGRLSPDHLAESTR